VAGWLGCEACSFGAVAGEVVLGAGGSVRRGAGQGLRRVGGSMSCRRACSAGLEGARIRGNVLHALRALGGMVMSD
jgi:hypothetical protein